MEFDVAIVGGGPAGLSAALVLGRARRKVVVIDAGDPAHFAADAVHGFLGMEGVPPRELRRRVWEQLEPFDVTLVEGRVETAAAVGDVADGLPEFALGLADGAVVRASAVVLAGGLRYGVQPVDGLAELWGDRLFHCPFCHGWEARGQRLAAIGPAAVIAHYAPMIGVWSDDVVPFAVGDAGDSGAAVVQRVRRDGDEVVIEASDGEHRVDAIFGAPVMAAGDDLAEQLGVPRVPTMPAVAAPVPVSLAADPMGATPVPGVFAAGDLVAAGPSVAGAVFTGSWAAAGIVKAISEGAVRSQRA